MINITEKRAQNKMRLTAINHEQDSIENVRQLIIDMDGTFVDLYNVPNWEKQLKNSIVTPYEIAEPLVDMEEFNAVLNEFRALGGKVVICSWTAMDATKEYNAAVRKAKRTWCEKYDVPIDEFHAVKYGTKKWYPLKDKNDAVLFDDNAAVRDEFVSKKFNRTACDVDNLIYVIKSIIKNMTKTGGQIADFMIRTALKNKIMAYCYSAIDHEGNRFIKIGKTTDGINRIVNYTYKVNGKNYHPHDHEFIFFYPCKTDNHARRMENALRDYFLDNCKDVNTQYVPEDRFYDVPYSIWDMIEADKDLVKKYCKLGYPSPEVLINLPSYFN